MESPLFTDEEQLSELLKQVQDFAVDFRLDNLRPTGSTLTDVPAVELPEEGAGAQDAINVFQKQWLPYLVAFTAKNADEELINRLAAVLNARGKYFMTPTTLNGRRGLRAAFVNWQTEPHQVNEIMHELNTALHQARTAPAAAPKKF